MKIKIGIDISPLKNANRFRGVGFYTKNLVEALQKLIKEDKKYSSFQIELIEQQYSNSNITIQQFSLIHYPYFNPFFSTLPKYEKVPVVVTVHDLTPLKFSKHYPPGIKGKLRWFGQKNRLRKVRAIITDSQNSKKDIIKIVGYPENQIHVVYLAPDSNFKVIKSTTILCSIVVKYELPKKFVLYVGDVNWNKNVPGLVKACGKIGIPLVIVGKQAVSKDFDQNHPENQDLVWLQKEAQNNPHIHLLGFVDDKDLPVIYNLATVYCQPSFHEGFGLPVLEAAQCGCPVVCSNQGSLPEVGEEVVAYFNPWQERDLEKTLKKVWGSEALRKKLSQKGLAQAKKFSWQKTAKNTVKVYQAVLKQ